MNFCDYKDIFGKPNTGVHAYRIGESITSGGFALVDILLTILFAGVLSYIIKCGFVITLIFLFIASIILHSLFCVDTSVQHILSRLDTNYHF